MDTVSLNIEAANIDAIVDKSHSSDDENTKVSHDEELGKGKDELHQKRTKPFIVLVAMIAALGGLIFGYDIAGAGATFLMPGFQEHFGWTNATTQEMDRDKGFINGLFGAGATLGAIASPWLADKYGRKACLFAASMTFIFGAGLQAGAPTMPVMFVGRVFSGLGIGGLSMCSPVYIAELAPEHARGQLSTLWQLSITAGILIASAANIGLQEWSDGWRISYGGVSHVIGGQPGEYATALNGRIN